MKAIWQGSISFGLVNIPVKLYSAVEKQMLQMRMLHKTKLSPIRYKRWCDDCEEEVAWGDIVRGLEVKKGRYIVLTNEELKAIKPERSSRIEVVQFVDEEKIDPLLLESHYYAGPKAAGEKTYFLFLQALGNAKKIAIGRFVMRTKEYVCAIRTHGDGLLLSTLNYAYEIRSMAGIEELKGKQPKITQQEIELAEQLIDKISVKKFEIGKFEDTFAEGLKEVVKKKVRGVKIKVPEPPKERKEENLIEALKASL